MSKKENFMAEGFDLRRFLLLATGKVWWLFIGAVIGALLFGGGYYAKHTLKAEPAVYRSDALYYIAFTEGKQDVTQLYYNDYTWNDVLDSDEVAGIAAMMSGGLTKEQIAAATRVPTMSDIRFIHVYVDDSDPEVAEQIQNAIGVALSYFSHQVDGIDEIAQWDRKEPEIYKDKNLINRWLIAGAVLGAVCALLGVAYVYVMDDKIRLEKDLYRIPGMREKVVGSLFAQKSDAKEEQQLKERLAEIVGEQTQVKLVGLEQAPGDAVEKMIRAALPEGVEIVKAKAKSGNGKKKKASAEAKKNAENTEAAGAVSICCVKAGSLRAEQLERLWNQTKAADAVVLTDVKYSLHKAYYLGKDKA